MGKYWYLPSLAAWNTAVDSRPLTGTYHHRYIYIYMYICIYIHCGDVNWLDTSARFITLHIWTVHITSPPYICHACTLPIEASKGQNNIHMIVMFELNAILFNVLKNIICFILYSSLSKIIQLINIYEQSSFLEYWKRNHVFFIDTEFLNIFQCPLGVRYKI